MRKLLAILLCTVALNAFAQGDTTIYQLAFEKPRFPGCEQLDTTVQVKYECSQRSLLNFVYQNIQYPFEAQRQNIEGTVVAQFVVEKDGTVGQPSIVRGLGAGTGAEVLRILNGMNEVGIRWTPGRDEAGTVIRTKQTLPVRFELKELPPYVFVGYDTVYTEFVDTLAYRGGDDALFDFLADRLTYPPRYVDSCMIGSVDASLLVRPDGSVRVVDLTNYDDLNYHFLYETIFVGYQTVGRWDYATFGGRDVPAVYNYTAYFRSPNPQCDAMEALYLRASALAERGALLANEGKVEEALAELNQAVELFPRNANFRYLRGQVYLNANRYEEACADYTVLLEVADIGEVRGVLPFVCK